MFLFQEADKLLTIFEKQISIYVPTGRGPHKIVRWCCIMPVSMYFCCLQYDHWFGHHSTSTDICHNSCVGCLLYCSPVMPITFCVFGTSPTSHSSTFHLLLGSASSFQSATHFLRFSKIFFIDPGLAEIA